jgi:hypothetical protein
MTVVLYDSVCTPCVRKQLWKQLKAKAAEKRLLLQRKDVRKDPQAKHDADNLYGRAVPFVVLDGKDMSIEEFLQ